MYSAGGGRREGELARSQAAHLDPYLGIERAENILVADMIYKGTGGA